MVDMKTVKVQLTVEDLQKLIFGLDMMTADKLQTLYPKLANATVIRKELGETDQLRNKLNLALTVLE